METSFSELSAQIFALWQKAQVELRLLLYPSRLVQVAILAGIFVASWLLRRWLTPKITDWMRSLEGRPKWQLRALVTLRNRLQLIFFVVLTWLASGIMARINDQIWRRFMLDLAATISTAMLGVALASWLIRNPTLRRIVVWALWIWLFAYFLGLSDALAAFLDSIAITLGGFRLSLYGLLKALVVTMALFALAHVATSAAARRIRENPDISPSVQVLSVKLLQVVAYAAAFFIGLKAVGFDLTGLAFLSGAIGVGIGFGLQKVVSNLVSGLIILLDKSIKPGDVITVGDTFGWINSLGARYVSITTRDGREYLVPNEDLITGQVVNWSHSDSYVRIDLTFGTSYHDDPHLVRKLAVEAAQSVDRVLSFRPAVCHITGFGDSSVDYILRFWITDPRAGLTNIRGNVFLALWDSFREHGISIPFPQREVRMLEGSTLETTRAPGAAPDAGERPQPPD